MKVLSLFDGMSCLQIALIEAGISFDTYYASEIDTHAIKQTQLNFPDTIQLGSVTEWKTWDIDWSEIDLIGAGSPCQGFSFAGKQLAFNDPRSKLFFVFIDILNHCRKFNPDVKFLLENVDMKREHMKVINDYCGLFPVNINSNLVSAQNRNRWYWSNIRTKTVGLFGETHTDIPQPKDEGILLKDILEPDVDDKYYLSENAIKYLNRTEMNERFIQDENDDKGACVTANYQKGIPYNALCVAMRGRNPENPSDRTPGAPTEQRLEPNTSGKTNCLTSVQKDNLVMKIVGNVYNSNGQAGKIVDTDFKSPPVTGQRVNSQGFINTIRIRRLTPTECARLQTVPDWYIWACSDTQQYRMLGNGWTIKVIRHILSYYKNDTQKIAYEISNAINQYQLCTTTQSHYQEKP